MTDKNSGLGKMLTFTVLTGCVIWGVRSCADGGSSPAAIANPTIQQATLDGQTSPQQVEQYQASPQRVIAQRNDLLQTALTQSQDLLIAAVCARKEQLLLQAREAQKSRIQTAEDHLLAVARDIQAKALRANSEHGVFSGSAEEMAIANPLVIDQLAVLQAYQELTQGKAQIGMCAVNFGSALVTNEQLLQLSEAIAMAEKHRNDSITGGAQNANND